MLERFLSALKKRFERERHPYARDSVLLLQQQRRVDEREHPWYKNFLKKRRIDNRTLGVLRK